MDPNLNVGDSWTTSSSFSSPPSSNSPDFDTFLQEQTTPSISANLQQQYQPHPGLDFGAQTAAFGVSLDDFPIQDIAEPHNVPIDLDDEELPTADTGDPNDEQDTARKAFHPKRPHKKSRKGCKNCKSRKVKCDEARPSCRSCRLRKVECVYAVSQSEPASKKVTKPSSTTANKLNPSTQVAAAASTYGALPSRPAASQSSFDSPEAEFTYDDRNNGSLAVPPYSSTFPFTDSPASTSPDIFTDFDLEKTLQQPPPIIFEPMFHPPSVDTVNLKLLWFYMMRTTTSFSTGYSRSRDVENVLKTTLLQYAFESPFLLDSVFALASVHQQHLGQPANDRKILLYRSKSYEGYRRAVEMARPQDYAALLANSLLLCAISSQTFREPDCKPLFIVDWLVVWRGIGLIFDMMGRRCIAATGLMALFYRPIIALDSAPPLLPNALVSMLAAIKPGDPDYPHVQTYYDGLKYLGSLYVNLQKDHVTPQMTLRIITWSTFIHKSFVDLIRQYRPRALIIIAHYAIFLKLVQDVWWLENVGQRTIEDLCSHLLPTWQAYMRVPMEAKQAGSSLEIIKVLLDNADWQTPAPAWEWCGDEGQDDCDELLAATGRSPVPPNPPIEKEVLSAVVSRTQPHLPTPPREV